MEREGSSPHSQEPATYPYTEPEQSNPFLQILLLEDPFYLFIYLQRNVASLTGWRQTFRDTVVVNDSNTGLPHSFEVEAYNDIHVKITKSNNKIST
jgi:hypothetical protein